MSAEARAWKASHDMLLGLHLVGHGNRTEVFKQRSDTMRSEGLLWHRQGRSLGRQHSSRATVTV